MKTVFYLIVSLILFSCNETPSNKSANDKKDSVVYAYGCASKISDMDWYLSNQKAPLFEGLDGVNFPITTSSEEAQIYFNQGMMLAYGFNHAEAARSFWQATRIDSTCAMCWWGFAYVLGPNYNAGMEPDNYERAYVAIQKAIRYQTKCTGKEKALIHALSNRYTKEVAENRHPLDSAYSASMNEVYKKFGDDPDIASMYAESLMDMHPWDLYNHDGTAKPWTPEIESVLEKTIAAFPKHVGANHFYIHAVEASHTADRGLSSANLLETLVPGSGHLVHMPSHIYIRTGHYYEGWMCNERACEVDSLYLEKCHAYGAYPLGYYPHNAHFIAACAALAGNSKAAMEGSWKTSMLTAKDLLDQPGMGTLQHYYMIPWYTSVKFSQWNTILKMEMPYTKLKYPMGVMHYARGMAHCGLGQFDEAQKDLDLLHEVLQDSTVFDITIWEINSVGTLLRIAENVLAGEIAIAKGDLAKAEALLKKAVSIEDELNYNEPPDWFFSTRHYLGNTLLREKKFGLAEFIFREDLINFPENGFALEGLYQALKGQNKMIEAEEVLVRFNIAWSNADCELENALVVN